MDKKNPVKSLQEGHSLQVETARSQFYSNCGHSMFSLFNQQFHQTYFLMHMLNNCVAIPQFLLGDLDISEGTNTVDKMSLQEL